MMATQQARELFDQTGQELALKVANAWIKASRHTLPAWWLRNERDVIRNIARQRAWEATLNYVPERGSYESYVYNIVCFALIDHVRQDLGRTANARQRQCQRFASGRRRAHLADPRRNNPALLAASQDFLDTVLARLKPRSQVFARKRYLEGCTLKETGQAIGVTESRCCQMEKEILAHLREALA